MERLNFQTLKKNGNLHLKRKNFTTVKTQKNFTAWKCFHIPLVKYIWATLEIIQWEM